MHTSWITASGPQGQCLAVKRDGGRVLITEDERPEQVVVTSPQNFATFLQGVKDGTFDDLVADVEEPALANG